jgi:hypothetical protein
MLNTSKDNSKAIQKSSSISLLKVGEISTFYPIFKFIDMVEFKVSLNNQLPLN